MSKCFVPVLLSLSLALPVLSGAASAAPPAPGAGSAGASMPAYNPTQDYQAGVAALQASKFKEADRFLTRVLGAVPNDSKILTLSGMAKAGANDLRGAQRILERAVKADAKNIDARRELAIVYARLGASTAPKALAELTTLRTRAQTCNNTCPEAAALKAAIAAVEAATASPTAGARLSDPSLLLASAKAGDQAYVDAVGLINQGRFDEAITTLEVAQKAFGPHPDVLTYIGFSHRKLGRFDQAERYYKEALEVAPDHRAATEYYGELMVERGDLAGAKRMLAKLEELCTFSCAEAQELRRWIGAAQAL